MITNRRIDSRDLPLPAAGEPQKWRHAVERFLASGDDVNEILGEADGKRAVNGLRSAVGNLGVEHQVRVTLRSGRAFLLKV